MLLVDTPGLILQQDQAGGGTRVLRSALQVDDIVDPIQPVESLLEKIEKPEILRHYRIGNFSNATEMLEQIAKKKGLVDEVVQEQSQEGASGKK